jgi:hypothetical protein
MDDPYITINKFRQLYRVRKADVKKSRKHTKNTVVVNEFGLSMREIIKYENYFLSSCVFSTTEDFFNVLYGLQDENLYYISINQKNNEIINSINRELDVIKEYNNNNLLDLIYQQEQQLSSIIENNRHLEEQKDKLLHTFEEDENQSLSKIIKQIHDKIVSLNILKAKRPAPYSNNAINKLMDIEHGINILLDNFETIKSKKSTLVDKILDDLNTQKKVNKASMQKQLIIEKRLKIQKDIMNRALRTFVRVKRRFATRIRPNRRKLRSMNKMNKSFESNDLLQYD